MFLYTYKSNKSSAIGEEWDAVAFHSSNTDLLQEMQDWCYQVFGDPGNGTRWVDSIRYGEVLFSNESDLIVFTLKWS